MILNLGPLKYSRQFEFTLSGKPIVGIFLSGGLDSAALLCLIIEELIKTKKIEETKVVAFTVFKPTGEIDYAKRILHLITSHYKIEIEHIDNLQNSEPYLSLGRFDPSQIKKMYDRYNNDIEIYLAANNMPKKNTTDFKGQLGFEYTVSEFCSFPFLDLLKPQMIDILYKLNVDFLIPYSHSCSKQMISRCNNCYSCEERSWGFNSLDINDPDTIPL